MAIKLVHSDVADPAYAVDEDQAVALEALGWTREDHAGHAADVDPDVDPAA
jgi:hypothetical protein